MLGGMIEAAKRPWRGVPSMANKLSGVTAAAAAILVLAASAAGQGAADPAAAERDKWLSLHSALQSAALTDAACAARFATQLRDARNAAQAYLRAVATGNVLWAQERGEVLLRPPAPPPVAEANDLLAAETAETEARLKELALVPALTEASGAVRESQEKIRFEWRTLPDALAALEGRLAPLAARAEGIQATLRVQQGPLLAEAQRLETMYDLLETEVARRCSRTTAPGPRQDPFEVPVSPPRRPAEPKKP